MTISFSRIRRWDGWPTLLFGVLLPCVVALAIGVYLMP
jgi:hypothetical protein